MKPFRYPTRIYAHRGGGTLAPENTLEAMQLAHRMGFGAVEFDVMLSRDHVPVLMHDPQFGRTVQGTGEVAAHTAAQLTQMNAGAWQGRPEYAQAKVPLFEDVVRYCRHAHLHMNIEIKPTPGIEAITGEVVARETLRLFADEADPARWPLFSSFKADAIAAAQRIAPTIPRAMLYSTLPANWQEELQRLACSALHTNYRHLHAATAQSIKAAGLGLLVYTVNEMQSARAVFELGVDALCTDKLELIGPCFQ
jgi:glycerophosphoryl diester phosphodiesterase